MQVYLFIPEVKATVFKTYLYNYSLYSIQYNANDEGFDNNVSNASQYYIGYVYAAEDHSAKI